MFYYINTTKFLILNIYFTSYHQEFTLAIKNTQINTCYTNKSDHEKESFNTNYLEV